MNRFSPIFRGCAPALLLVLALAVPAAAQSPCGEQVTVRRGDTLARIAQRCDTTVEEMVQENELIDDPDVLEVGWVLKVPPVDPVDQARNGRGERPGDAPPPGEAAPGSAPDRPDAHLVAPGDTLARIAARYGVALDALVALNRIRDPDRIHVGERIVLPGGGGEDDGDDGRDDDRGDGRDGRGDGDDDRGGDDGDDHDRDDGDGGEDDGEPITVRGTLTGEGVECPTLRTAEGEVYTLTGDLGGAATGDVVEVTGRIARFSICMQGTTLTVEKIEPVD